MQETVHDDEVLLVNLGLVRKEREMNKGEVSIEVTPVTAPGEFQGTDISGMAVQEPTVSQGECAIEISELVHTPATTA